VKVLIVEDFNEIPELIVSFNERDKITALSRPPRLQPCIFLTCNAPVEIGEWQFLA